MLTDKRLVMIDKGGIMGVAGKKTRVSSHPWEAVSSWTYSNSGKVDFDAELIVRVKVGPPLSIKFPKNFDLQPLVKAIAEHCLNGDDSASPSHSPIPNFIKKVRSNKE